MSRPYQSRCRTLSPRLVMVGLLAAFTAGCDRAPEVTGPRTLSATDDLMSQMAKIDVCHRNANGQYGKISIADAAYDSHIAHGDGGVGEAVPGTPGYEFGAECQPQEIEIETPECPCFSATSIAQALADQWFDVSSVVLSDNDLEGGFYRTTLSTPLDPSIGAGWDLFQASHVDGHYPSCTVFRVSSEQPVTSAEAAVCRSILLEYDS